MHFDYGFGAHADAFKEVADTLKTEIEPAEKPALNMHLPKNFLYRHAIEIYLKSMIIIIHKRLKLDYGDSNSSSEPCVLVEDKWKPMYKVHSIKVLYNYYKTLIKSEQNSLSKISNTEWGSIPKEIDEHVDYIESTDSNSTFFRYPLTGNDLISKNKASFYETDLQEIFAKMGPSEGYSKSFLVVDQNHRVSKAFRLNQKPLRELSNALQNVATYLEGVHFGMRVELCAGE